MAHIDYTKNPNDSVLYVNTSSNHPRQVIKHIPISISKRLNKNSSSKEIFHETISEYETALTNSGYQKAELKFHKEQKYSKNENEVVTFGSTLLLVAMSLPM